MRPWIALLVLLLAGCAEPPQPGVTELVYATPYGPDHPFSRADKTWMTFVEARSEGRIKIRPIWSGALLSADQSMTELRHGIADIGLITPIYARGGAHLIRIQSGFYSGVREVEEQVALYRCMERLHRQFKEELDGLEVLAVQGGSLPGVITRHRAVLTLKDFKGLRLRAPTELLSVLRSVGADPVNMPMGEVYSAMAKGIIDGVVAPADTFKAMHFAEVSHHFTTLAVPRGAYPARAMGSARWRSLADEERDVLREATAVWESALAEETRAALASGLSFADAQGVKIHEASAELQAAFDEAYLREIERNAASLARFGIDGLAAFQTARASIDPNGTVQCEDRS